MPVTSKSKDVKPTKAKKQGLRSYLQVAGVDLAVAKQVTGEDDTAATWGDIEDRLVVYLRARKRKQN